MTASAQPTAAAGAGARTFHGQNELAGGRDLSLEDAHIRNIKRYRNEWLIRLSRHGSGDLVDSCHTDVTGLARGTGR